MKKFILIFTITLYSTTASAGLLEDIVEGLKNMFSGSFGNNFSRTINSYVTPPKPECNTATDTEIEQFAEEEEVPEVGAIPNVEIVTKTEAEPGSLRDILKNNYAKLGGDSVALEQALCFYDKNTNTNFSAAGDPSRSKGIKIQNQRYITINDLNKSSLKPRMYVLDLETGKVKSYFTGHGIGGKNGVEQSTVDNVVTSNTDSSFATPRGFFITGSRINGSSDPQQRWKFSMKLHGLQKGVNDKSYSRAVVMHGFPGMDETSFSSDEENPNVNYRPNSYAMSWGCTMTAPAASNEIIETIKAPNGSSGGSLYYNYSSTEKSRGEAYCGDENLMKK